MMVRVMRNWRLTWWLFALWTRARGLKSRLAHNVSGRKNHPPRSPHVLIVCAHHNGSDWLRACVNSVLAQDFSDWTLMLIDDASTDDSVAVIGQLASKDARIRGWALEKNVGAYIARNTAVALASGALLVQADAGVPWTHISLIDSDDVAAPNWLSHMLEVLADDQGLVRSVLERRDIDLIKTRRRYHSYCQTLYSRQLWEALGGFHPVRVAADDELLVRAHRFISLTNALSRPPSNALHPRQFVSRKSWKTAQYMRTHGHNASDEQPIERKRWTTARRREIQAATTPEQLQLKPVEIAMARPVIGIESEC